MEHSRRKSTSRQGLANSLRGGDRHNFHRMFHPGFPEPFDKDALEVDDMEHAIADERTVRIQASELGDDAYDGKVTVLGDYINHHAKEGLPSTLPKSRKNKLDAVSIDLEATTLPHSPRQNHLLASLDAADYQRLLPHLELVALPLGCVVCEAGSHMDYVYFPTTSIVSNFYELESGASAEISVTGNDGLVGIALIMGGETTTSRAVVRNAGHGYRLEAELLKREFENGPMLRSVLLRYTQALITQMAQIAVCNCHHNVEQQLCRLLLFSLDRLPGNEMALTQELIASLLGVRRESVTEVAGKLQAAGLIRYNRGHISVLDRRQMERRVCECYAVVKSEFDRLLPRDDAEASLPVAVGRDFAGSFNFRSQLEPLRRSNGDRRRLA